MKSNTYELEKITRELSPYLCDDEIQKLLSSLDRYAKFDGNIMNECYLKLKEMNHTSEYAKLLFNIFILKYCIRYDETENIYRNNQDDYDLTVYIDSNQEESLLDLKINKNDKVDMMFYDDILYTDKLRDTEIKKAELNFRLDKNKNKSFEELTIGSSDSYYNMQTLDVYNEIIENENNKLYNNNENKDIILARKLIIDDFTNQFNANLSYHRIPEDMLKDGNKVLIKSYPYMDLSICYKKTSKKK